MNSNYKLISFFKKILGKHKRGFTLVELLVIIFVIVSLSTLVFVNYKTGSKMLNLQRASQKLAQDIRYAQEMSISGVECITCSSEPAGYGVFIDKSSDNKSYFIYADIDGNQYYQLLQDEIVENFDLEEGVIIHDISDSSSVVCINFSPPDPIVRIGYDPGVGSALEEAFVILALESDTAQTKKVNVNAVGLIEVVAASSSLPPSGECRSGIGGDYPPCDEITYGGYLNCFFPDTCTPCGCNCFMFQCRDPVGGPPLCSSFGEALCNTCGCTWVTS